MDQPQQQPQQPPPIGIYQQAASAHGSGPPNGSIGMVVVVLAVITILGVVAGVIGRLCAGRRFSGDSEYDFEGWVERKCSTCIDGHTDSSASLPNNVHVPIAEADPPPPAS
eukprot:TRINITY_DN15014_c0_g1_i1.p1 TRINITY_DN15014_c0_g1~~TRINITY_DN15014_c0_g1_i1.p1  ORF type:complete len:111 (+),score=0.12 TRINITY_DN15014_c0_g1_i1:525-857(+)